MACATEFFATLFAFGAGKVKPYLYIFFCILLFPWKYLDVFFVQRRAFQTLAPTLLLTLRKPDRPDTERSPSPRIF